MSGARSSPHRLVLQYLHLGAVQVGRGDVVEVGVHPEDAVSRVVDTDAVRPHHPATARDLAVLRAVHVGPVDARRRLRPVRPEHVPGGRRRRGA